MWISNFNSTVRFSARADNQMCDVDVSKGSCVAIRDEGQGTLGKESKSQLLYSESVK
jgi:hypothetical protein